MTGKKVGIVCCSNGMKRSYSGKIKMLEEKLRSIGLVPEFSRYIYEKEGAFCGTAKERAQALMDFYENDEIGEIFDISGGDVANGVLPYLDYDVIAKSEKRFWGYSDLTTILNGIYAKTGKSSVLYQIRNVLYEYGDQQAMDVKSTLVEPENALFQIKYHFIQQEKMQGVVIGGNIRCFLKLAGTEYMPDFKDKILLLESRSGRVPQMETYLSQLQQIGAFEQISGILLGTFTQMEEEQCKPEMPELLLNYVGEDMPIAVTREIGHGMDAKVIMIGVRMTF